jgi:hypothetical protein
MYKSDSLCILLLGFAHPTIPYKLFANNSSRLNPKLPIIRTNYRQGKKARSNPLGCFFLDRLK